MSDQLDRIEKKVDQITTVLGGSGMGDNGLIAQHRELKSDYYKTKSEVSKLKWFASLIATGVSALVTGIATFFKS